MASKIKCPICGNKYSGDTCPNCGAPAPRKKKSGKLKWIVIAIVIVLFLLFAVGNSGGSNSSSSTNEFKNAPVSSAEKEDSGTNLVPDNKEKAETEEAEETENKNEDSGEFDEIPVLESEDYTVKITNISNGFLSDYRWTLYIENRTNKDVMVSVDNVSVDGIMSDPFWATEIAANKNGYSEVDWQSLSDYGISEPTIIEGTLHIYDNDTWEDYYKEPFTVMPLGEEKVQKLSREPKDTDQVLIDNEYVTVTRTGYEVSGSLEMALFIEAKTENPITVSIDDCALNNTMCDPFWACSVSGNKVAVSTVEWSSDSLKDSNLKAENITDISFSMRVYNSESWEDYVEEKISLTTEK